MTLSGTLPQATRAPWTFRFAGWLDDHGFRGGHRLLEWARAKGKLQRIIQYELPQSKFELPLYRPENCWTQNQVQNYEPELINALTEEINKSSDPVQLIDCGADIGTVSAVLFSKCPRFKEITAFEPNPESYPFAERNLYHLPTQTRVLMSAVSDFEGRGKLVSPDYDDSPHAMFIVPDNEGDIAVTTIDNLDLSTDGTIVIKIDTEGTELNVIRGGKKTIEAAKHVILAFEAHPEVTSRTEIDPCDILAELNSIRPFAFHVAEFSNTTVDCQRPLFEQIQLDDPYGLNVVCVSE